MPTRLVDKEEARFFLFRYLLSPALPEVKGARRLPSPKGAAVSVALGIGGEHVFSKGDVEYLFAGFRPAEDFADVPTDRRGLVFVGKLGRRRIVEIGRHVPADIVPSDEEDWRSALMIVDARKQVIAVEANKQLGSAEATANTLVSGLLVPVMREYGHRVAVEMISDPRQFWSLVEGAERIYKARFSLESPNPDDFPQEIEELVKRFRALTHQDRLDLGFENDSGELVIEPSLFQALLSYVIAGGGKWWLTFLRHGKKKKETAKSSDNATMVSSDYMRERTIADDGQKTERTIDLEKHAIAAVLAAAARIGEP